VYQDFEEAQTAIGRNAGSYDSSAGAALYHDRVGKLQAEDYPILYWMSAFASNLRRIFDFGGHVGLHYYALAPKLQLPSSHVWSVSDVPAVMQEGERLARSRGVSSLHFAGGMDGADGADVFLSSGALQYLEESALPRALGACVNKPRHVLLNKLPVRSGDSFVTVQDTGFFRVPYTVFDRARLVEGLKALGYRLRDEWQNPGLTCLLWRKPDLSVSAYSGFYFERAS
jgi:putative methyltransferase (TIGR04325 family)